MTNEEINAYVNSGRTSPAIAMRELLDNGVSVQQYAQATGSPVQNVMSMYQNVSRNPSAYSSVASQQSSQQSQAPTRTYSADEIRSWLDSNQGASDVQIAQAMRDNGVTVDQMAEAAGMPIDQVRQRFDAAGAQLSAPPTGLVGSEQALQGGLDSALSALAAGYDQARGDVAGYNQQAENLARESYGQGQQALAPYQNAGAGSIGALQALSGASGQEAFDQAYVESPYMKFLAEQGNRGVVNNASALGGLGGGNVMKELSRYNQGLAGQGLQQQIGNLQYLTGLGSGAASTSANMNAGLGNLLAGNAQATGGSLGNLAANTANTAGNYAFQTGGALSQGRTNAGNALAGQISQASQDMANLAQGNGSNVAGVIGQQGNNLANILMQAGLSQAQIQQILSQNQSQVAQNAGANYAGVPGANTNPQNMLGQVGQVAGGIGTLLGALG